MILTISGQLQVTFIAVDFPFDFVDQAGLGCKAHRSFMRSGLILYITALSNSENIPYCTTHYKETSLTVIVIMSCPAANGGDPLTATRFMTCLLASPILSVANAPRD